MLRKQPCLKLSYTSPRVKARRDSFKVGLGTKNQIFPVHKYQSHQCVEGTKAKILVLCRGFPKKK